MPRVGRACLAPALSATLRGSPAWSGWSALCLPGNGLRVVAGHFTGLVQHQLRVDGVEAEAAHLHQGILDSAGRQEFLDAVGHLTLPSWSM